MLQRSFLSIVIMVSIFFTSYHIPRAYSETAEELQSNLNALSAQISALDLEIKAYNKKINSTQGEAKTLKQALTQLEIRHEGLVKDITYTKLRIRQTDQNINFTKDKIATTEDSLERTRAALSEALRSLVHNEQSIPPFVGALASGAHFSDIVDTEKRTGDVTKVINEKARVLVDVKATLAVEKASYEQHKSTLLSLNQRLSNQKQIVDQTSKDKSTLLLQTKDKEAQYQKLLSDRKKKKSDLESEMLDVESKLKTIVDSSKIPKYGKGVLRYPLDTVVITQYFGNTPFASKNPQVYNGSGHNGIDLGTKIGTPIYTAAPGVVLSTGNTDASCSGVSYGKWVLVKHDNGLSSLYAHLSVISVKSGDVLSGREQVGLSGNTGYSTGPHLHFTVYASDAVQITTYTSKVCGTTMVMPIAPRAGYLNPLSYL